MVYANIIHTKQLLCYKEFSFSGLGWRMSYDWRARASKWSLKMLCVLGHRLMGLLFNYSRHSTYSQAKPGLLNACICQLAKIRL